jgi:hypothetical protein
MAHMGKFDASIEWCRKQIANATESITDLKGGRKVEINDKDATQEWIAIYERIIEKCRRLIRAYGSRRD